VLSLVVHKYVCVCEILRVARVLQVKMNVLPYDAFNGSLVEQDLIHVVGNEQSPCEMIKKMDIGDMRPKESKVTVIKIPSSCCCI